MHHFAYRDGVLHAEDVNLHFLAEEAGTPFYCYSTATLERHYRVFDRAFAGTEHAIFYSAKANSNQAVIKTLVDPDVDAQTHHKITTGRAENKFGISFLKAREVYAHAASLPGIDVAGIDMHIGSQITALEPFEKAFRLMAELVIDLRKDGHDIRHLDLGGGLGVPYRGANDIPPHPDEYAAMIKRTLGSLGCRFVLEPGRMIAGNAGILIARVVYVKEGSAKRFVILDAAMNDLIRPTLYDAWHDLLPV